MRSLMRDLEKYVESGNFSNSSYYLNKYSREDYLTLFAIMKDWLLDGLEQHLPKKEVKTNSQMLLSSSLIYCSWIITHVLKKGVNDHSYNERKLKYIFSKTDLESKVNLNTIEDFLISGLGMAISQSSEILSIPNTEICHLVISLNLMITEHMISVKKEYRFA